MDRRWRATRAELEDADGLREAARSLRCAAIARLPELLGRLADNVEARGRPVFFAADAREATEYVVGLARERGARWSTKSKSMVTEEIRLNAALAAAGVEAVETDLGEWVSSSTASRPRTSSAPRCTDPGDWVRVLAPRGLRQRRDPRR